jgi:predicted ATPase/DNA-binding SARP family transcriptional activator
MSTLILSLLGPFAASLVGRALTKFRTNKVQALLIYLAVENKQAHRRDFLMELLWPGLPQPSAQVNLRQTIHRLNQAIPALVAKEPGSTIHDTETVPLLLSDRQSVQINPDGAYDLDVTVFTDLLKGKPTPEKLTQAVALYRGDFLSDFYLPDSSTFEEWAAAWRANLRRKVLEALDRLTTIHTQQGTYAEAAAYARRQLEIDNLRESAHRQLMGALAYSGQRNEALAQYELCSRLLRDELGVELAPATNDLCEQIRQNQFGPPVLIRSEIPVTVSVGEALPAEHKGLIARNLPAESTPLVGRETELERLNQLLAGPDERLITIVGIGGMGKTRLALEVAEQQVTRQQSNNAFSDGVCFVPLAPLGQADHILSALAQAINFQLQPGDRRTPEQQVLDFLKRKRLLLVFDNFEHILDGANLITDILQAAPHVKVLATSREPLRLYEEQVFPLEGLAFSDEMAAEEDAAVQLFLQRSRRVRPDFALQEADIPHLTTICRQVGGMPLALELTAAWIDTLSLTDIAEELRQSLDLLETAWRNVPGRHRSMRAVFEVSWRQLRDEEQHIFSHLSVFRGGFTRPAARQVCGPELSQPALRRILAALVGKSFLRYDPTPDRYDLHELLRQFGVEKLAQALEVERIVRDRHSAYFCALLHRHTENWHTAQQLETLAAVTREADNMQPAWRWALAQGEWQRLVQAIDSWGWYHNWQGRYADGEAFCQAIVKKAETQAIAETAVSPDCLRLWAKALAWHGFFTVDQSVALRELQQSLALLERSELAKGSIKNNFGH